MAVAVDERALRPLTADEVMRMVEAGILREDERVELLDGVLRQMSPKSPGHALLIMRLMRWLSAGVATRRYDVRIEDPLVVPASTSLPEPDVAVVRYDDTARHPTTALLVVEVAVTSLATDTQLKPALYAAADVPEYWVVDMRARSVEVLRGPEGERYRERTRHQPPGTLRPDQVEVEPLDLGELFAGL